MHRDCRFAFGLYRAWLAEAIGKASADEEPEFLASSHVLLGRRAASSCSWISGFDA